MGRPICSDKGKRFRQYCTSTDKFTTPYLDKEKMLLHLVLEGVYNRIPGLEIRATGINPMAIKESQDIEEYKEISHGEWYGEANKKEFFSDWKNILKVPLYDLIRERLQKRVENLEAGLKKGIPDTEKASAKSLILELSSLIDSLDNLMQK